MTGTYDPHRRAKKTLPEAVTASTDWQRLVLAALLGNPTGPLTDEQMSDQQLWLLAYANLCASRGTAEPAPLYTELAAKVEYFGELQDMLRDGIVAPLWDEIHKLRADLNPPA